MCAMVPAGVSVHPVADELLIKIPGKVEADQ
jgi:hypothetical protein